MFVLFLPGKVVVITGNFHGSQILQIILSRSLSTSSFTSTKNIERTHWKRDHRYHQILIIVIKAIAVLLVAIIIQRWPPLGGEVIGLRSLGSCFSCPRQVPLQRFLLCFLLLGCDLLSLFCTCEEEILFSAHSIIYSVHLGITFQTSSGPSFSALIWRSSLSHVHHKTKIVANAIKLHALIMSWNEKDSCKERHSFIYSCGPAAAQNWLLYFSSSVDLKDLGKVVLMNQLLWENLYKGEQKSFNYRLK